MKIRTFYDWQRELQYKDNHDNSMLLMLKKMFKNVFYIWHKKI